MKQLVVVCAAFGKGLFERCPKDELFWKTLRIRSLRSSYPALTCPAQAALRTAQKVSGHGMVTSGYYDRALRKAFFWEQSSSLFEGPRIWENFRARGGKVAQICLQQCPGLDSDWYLSPGPVHKHHGGMIQEFYANPPSLYHDICREIGATFNLMDYWGPFTSLRASDWIAKASVSVMKRLQSEPESLVVSYLSHLDYAPQKFGPDTPQTRKAFIEFEGLVKSLAAAAQDLGYELALIGDYDIGKAVHAICPNRILAERGYFVTRPVKTMRYPNLHSSRAFALADHQLCHLYRLDPTLSLGDLRSLFEGIPGVARILRREEEPSLNHPRSGDLILEAAEGYWFAYKWWDRDAEAPDFATHVDIHNKPGFDPLELYMKLWPPFSVPLDGDRLKGTHGRSCDVICATSFELPDGVDSYDAFAAYLRQRLG